MTGKRFIANRDLCALTRPLGVDHERRFSLPITHPCSQLEDRIARASSWRSNRNKPGQRKAEKKQRSCRSGAFRRVRKACAKVAGRPDPFSTGATGANAGPKCGLGEFSKTSR